MSQSARVVVYDASILQCELLKVGLESLGLGFMVRCAHRLDAMIELLSEDAHWVVVLSESSAGSNSVSMAKQIRGRYEGAALVFVLAEGRIDRVVEAFRAGARGIVYSNESLMQLANCISQVHQGEVCVRGVDLGKILDGLLKPALRLTDVTGRTLLSPREEEISRLVAEGMSNREVARALKISESTVKNSLFHVFEKLGISNRVELARYVNGSAAVEGRVVQ